MASPTNTIQSEGWLNGLRTETEIQNAYGAAETAAAYVHRRFASPLMEVMHDAQVSAVNELLAKRQTANVLEIAPGPGRITRHVKFDKPVTCLEFNSAMIEQGRGACRRDVRWVQGNAFEMDYREAFDCVYTFRFVRHFEMSDRKRLYDRIAAALRPSGVLLMDAVNRRASLPLRQARPEEYPVYDKLYDDVDEIRQELAAHGLILQSARPVLRWFRAQGLVQTIVGPRSQSLCRWFIRAMEKLPSTSPLEWIILCRRA